MIPVKLALKGIYSYRTKQEIDFEKLTQAHLFGIFGPVGCGKSTILEAISFCLYGETERLNQKDNRAYNMMNLKSGELDIEFIFRAGADNSTEYMFCVSGRRNRKNFGKIQSFDRKAYRRQNGEWIPIEPSGIENIIGLSYKNFRRTIIIPQGKFEEFLKLGDSDRTQMLKDIFHLDKFDLYDKTTVLEQQAQSKLSEIMGKLAQIGDISQDSVDEKVNRLKLMQDNIQSLTDELAELRAQEKKMHVIKDTSCKIERQRAFLAQLTAGEAKFEFMEKRLNDYIYCTQNFRHLLDRKSQTELKISSIRADIAQKRESLIMLEHKLAQKLKFFMDLKISFEKKEFIKTEIDDLAKINEIKKLDLQIETLSAQSGEIKESLERAETEIERYNCSKTGISARKKEIESSLPDMAELSDIKEWFIQKNNIELKINDLETETGLLKKDIAALENLKYEILSEDVCGKLLNKPAGSFTLTGIQSVLEEGICQVKSELDKLESQIRDLHVKDSLSHYADTLVDGQPCPLCGSLDHPNKLVPSEFYEEFDRTENMKQVYRKSFDTLNSAKDKLNTALGKLDSKSGLLDQKLAALMREKDNLKVHLAKFKWADTDIKSLDIAQKRIIQAQKVHNQKSELDKQLDDIDNQIKSVCAKKDTLDEQFRRIERDLSGAQAQKTLLINQLKLLKPENFSEYGGSDIDNLIRSNKDKLKGIEADYENCEKDIKEFERQIIEHKAKLESAEKNLNDELESANEINSAIQTELKKSKFDSIGEVESLLKLNLDTETEKREIRRFYEEKSSIENLIQSLENEIQGNPYDVQVHQDLITRINSFADSLSGVNQEIGKLKREIDSLKNGIAEKSVLTKEKSELEIRIEDISTLKQLFKGKGFVNYISTIFLKNLCEIANERFLKFTRGKLRLELAPDNSFSVRDFLNDGQTRSVKTLSGGQTFQAALSLALALADNIQRHTGSTRNFFFLDEGFGLLDPESLMVVFDTLKSLRKENRVVGIISHVEDLQQEIETCLIVKNDEEYGSIIRQNWS